MDNLVPLVVVVRIVFFRFGECKVVLDRLQALYPQLVLDGVKDFIDGEPQRSVVFFHLEGLERIQRENRERLSFVGGLHPIRVIYAWIREELYESSPLTHA